MKVRAVITIFTIMIFGCNSSPSTHIVQIKQGETGVVQNKITREIAPEILLPGNHTIYEYDSIGIYKMHDSVKVSQVTILIEDGSEFTIDELKLFYTIDPLHVATLHKDIGTSYKEYYLMPRIRRCVFDVFKKTANPEHQKDSIIQLIKICTDSKISKAIKVDNLKINL